MHWIEIVIIIIGIVGIGYALHCATPPKHNECGTRSRRTGMSGGTKYVTYWCDKCNKGFSAEIYNKKKQI